MRKIILNLAVTLDGFIEGPNGEVDWCRIDDDAASESAFESHFDSFLSGVDTIFYGRVSYDLWGQYQPDINASFVEKKLWQSVHSKAKYVFSRHPKKDKHARYISSDIAKSVHDIKNEAGKNIWLYGGSNLITTFINLGLIDNYLLAVYPVILGGGKPLFSDVKNRVQLRLNRVVTTASGVMLLDYGIR